MNPMRCHLLLPDLFPPAAHTAENDPLHRAHAPALQTLLARGHRSVASPTDMEGWLWDAFQPKDEGSIPAASLALLAEGRHHAAGFWLHADPVYLSLERDQLILTDPSAFPLEQEEADELTATLNRHFEADGLTFLALTPKRWYLRLRHPQELETHSIYRAAGRNIHPLLPQGPEGRRWRAMLNEIQMALHEHPVNTAREAAGLPPVNSVWLWGGGVLPQGLDAAFSHVWADSLLSRGLALAAGKNASPLPATGEQWLSEAGSGEHLVVLDALRLCASYGDTSAWKSILHQLETLWFAPLLKAAGRGRLEILLHAPTDHGTASFRVRRSDLWKFWRRPRTLSHYRPR